MNGELPALSSTLLSSQSTLGTGHCSPLTQVAPGPHEAPAERRWLHPFPRAGVPAPRGSL